jgi:hypothetical protein
VTLPLVFTNLYRAFCRSSKLFVPHWLSASHRTFGGTDGFGVAGYDWVGFFHVTVVAENGVSQHVAVFP